MTSEKRARIEQAIAECSDRKLIRLLNRAWWKEWFSQDVKLVPINGELEVLGRNAAVKILMEKSRRVA